MGLKVGDTYLDRGYHSVRSTVLALIGWSDPRRIKDETEICRNLRKQPHEGKATERGSEAVHTGCDGNVKRIQGTSH